MRKPREILGGLPLVGSYFKAYIAFEDRAAAWVTQSYRNWKARGEERKKRKGWSSKLAERMRRWPVIGPLMRFPRAMREWLGDIPLLGRLVIKPYFAVADWVGTHLIRAPLKAAGKFIALPLILAGALSGVMGNNPDLASESLHDYIKTRGITASIFNGVAHDHNKIRVYYDNRLTTALHIAANQVKHAQNMDGGQDQNALTRYFEAAIAYPIVLGTTAMQVVSRDNPFTTPPHGDDDICYIRMNGNDSDPLHMMSLLSGIPQKYLTLKKDDLAKWVPQMILGHEARHCDNGQDKYKLIAALQDLYKKQMKIREQELGKIMHDKNIGLDKAGKFLADNPRLREIEKEIIMKKRAIERATLSGEIDSDIHITRILDKQFPDFGIAKIMIDSRAVTPFTGSMSMTNNHATASGLQDALGHLETAGSFDTWDAIDMAKQLIRFGTFLNTDGTPVLGFDSTVRNYQVAKDVVIPYLQAHRDAYLPRDKRHVRFALVLEQAQLFVDGMESLVKPDILTRDVGLAGRISIPDMPVKTAPTVLQAHPAP